MGRDEGSVTRAGEHIGIQNHKEVRRTVALIGELIR
jgi:hypothetical protein